MTGTQYKNVAQWTLANGAAEASESAAAAKAIFDNMGVPFPAGSCGEILLTLMSEDYMGWRACTHLEAQEYANAGTAAVGIDGEHVVVILPEEGEDLVGAVVQANATSYARQASDISTAERITMQFYANSAATTPYKIAYNQIFGQSDSVKYPSDAPYSGNAFYDAKFIANVCGKTSANGATISDYGCAVCAVEMFILYKGGLTNTNDNVYNAVKSATIGTTDNEFRYNKNSFTATVGGKNIAITQVNNNIIPSNKDLTALKNALAANKCAVVCLRTSLTNNDTHFVLADALIGTSSDDLNRISVVDPASGGVRRTLRLAIERKLSPASAAYIASAYIIS